MASVIPRLIAHEQPEHQAHEADPQDGIAECRTPAECPCHPAGHEPHDQHRETDEDAQRPQCPAALTPWPPLGNETDPRAVAHGVDKTVDAPGDHQRDHGVAKAGEPIACGGEHTPQGDPPACAKAIRKPAVDQISQAKAPKHAGIDEPRHGPGDGQVIDDLKDDKAEVETAEVEEHIEAAEQQQHPPFPARIECRGAQPLSRMHVQGPRHRSSPWRRGPDGELRAERYYTRLAAPSKPPPAIADGHDFHLHPKRGVLYTAESSHASPEEGTLWY